MALLTIGIPVYNAVKHIENTINNISKVAKNVDYDIELLIIDNNSSDGTKDKLEKLQDNNPDLTMNIIFNLENEGFNSSCDKLMLYAIGEYLWIIGGQDLINPQGLEAIKNLSKFKVDYAICNARIIDEKTNQVINKNLWCGIKSQKFNSLEDFFRVMGGPCQALSCNIYSVEFITKFISEKHSTHLWGFIERIMDAIIEKRESLRIDFINIPFVDVLIESDGWQSLDVEHFGKFPAKAYGGFFPMLQISELYKLKLQPYSHLLQFAAPYRDSLGVLRNCIQARALGLPLDVQLLVRLLKVYGNSLVFLFISIPILLSPKFISKVLTNLRPLVHFIRQVFNIKTF